MGVLCSLCGRPLEGSSKSKDLEQQQYMVMTRRDSSLQDSNRSLMNKPTTVYSSLCNDTVDMEHLLLGISNCNNDNEADGPEPPPQSSGRTSDSDRQKRSAVAGRFEKA